MASFDSSSSGSRNGLNRYYRQAWENLHESAGSKSGLRAQPPDNLKRKEALDEAFKNGRHREGPEMSMPDGEKKRHHHHHHHHDAKSRPPPHKRY